jgi:hypothetical protein
MAFTLASHSGRFRIGLPVVEASASSPVFCFRFRRADGINNGGVLSRRTPTGNTVLVDNPFDLINIPHTTDLDLDTRLSGRGNPNAANT